MTVTLTFKPEAEAGLLAKAQARGMDLEEYLLAIVERDAAPPPQITAVSDTIRRQGTVRRMLEFGDKYRLALR